MKALFKRIKASANNITAEVKYQADRTVAMLDNSVGYQAREFGRKVEFKTHGGTI